MLLAILGWIATLLAVLVIFGFTIFAHEFGHFLFARWRGLVVEEFAIGFGPKLWSRTVKGVEWSLRAVPFGGFVALPQLAPMEMIEGRRGHSAANYPRAGALDKIIAAFGGPLFSALLGLFLAVVVWIVGKPFNPLETTTVVGFVEPDSPAATAPDPFLPGDKILAIDGRPVTAWSSTPSSIVEGIVFSLGDAVRFDIERPTEDGAVLPRTLSIVPRLNKERDNLRQVGISPAHQLVVEKVAPGSPAESAGLKPGDEIVQVNNRPVYGAPQYLAIVEKSAGQPLILGFRREGEKRSTVLTPRIPVGYDAAVDGVKWQSPEHGLTHPTPWRQVGDSFTWISKTLGAIFNPKSHVKAHHLSGPVGIIQNYHALLQADILLVLWFSVVLNINLAFLNLLPIPVLDGGHILFAAIEGLSRRPLPAKLVHALQSAFAVLLLSFMLYVTFFDARRGIRGLNQEREAAEKQAKRPAEMRFETSPAPATP